VYCRPRGFAFGIVLSLAAVTLFQTACIRQPAQPQKQRLAILRFENLSPDRASDWIGRAIPVVLEAQLRDAPGVTVLGTAAMHVFDRSMGIRPISAPGVSSERSLALAAGANEIAYGDYVVLQGPRNTAKLRVRLWLENPQTQQIFKTIEIARAPDDAIGVAGDLAREFTSQPAPYSTRSEGCLREYTQGLESTDAAQAVSHLEAAIATDADFGPAYRALSEIDLQRQNRDGSLEVLRRGLARTGIDPLERGRLQLGLAGIENDVAAQQQALTALTKLEPASAATWKSLGDVALARHDYAQALAAYRRASDLEPENVPLLNEIGFAATYGGHFDEGLAALRKYQSMRPKDANAVDSMGDIYLLTGRYKEAEDSYQKARKVDPNFLNNADLFKAAMARAMTGDLAGADEISKQYIVARTVGHDANAPYMHGEWLFLTGRRKEALTEMQAFAHTAEAHGDRGTAARAGARIAEWQVMDGDRAAAQQTIQKAAAIADQTSAAPVAVARFLSQPSASAEEWTARANRFVPNPAQNAIQTQLLAFALLLDGKFQAAKAPLERLYEASGVGSATALGSTEGLPVLIAWSEVESGAFDAAAPLIALTPVPPPTGVGAFTPLWFPRLYDLRAKIAAKSGKADEAKANRELYGKLSGR
jgi:tetratricopeptide (TPR) repeat protein